LAQEKKAARLWNKKRHQKEWNRRAITPCLKGNYEIRKITEEEKIEHAQLRKMNMFEIYVKYNQISKSFPPTVFKEKVDTFYLHKKESNLKIYKINFSLYLNLHQKLILKTLQKKMK
jgi:hypothetical protein